MANVFDTAKYILEQSGTMSRKYGIILWRIIRKKSELNRKKIQKDKEHNHSISVENLNKVAQKRLAERFIEAESLISLRITGNHRLYGYMSGRVFNILWYDDNHGDNKTCVRRSYLKHT